MTTAVRVAFTPLHDRILVRLAENTQEQKHGRIIIPDAAQEKPREAEVMAIGKGKSNEQGQVFPLDVQVGDTILFGKYSGHEIRIDGEDFLVMNENDVLGILHR